jgi:hypothetical protein
MGYRSYANYHHDDYYSCLTMDYQDTQVSNIFNWKCAGVETYSTSWLLDSVDVPKDTPLRFTFRGLL